ncbi:TPA: DUF4014 family protein [Salmonella enterica subsp. enterica serovar Muenchen]
MPKLTVKQLIKELRKMPPEALVIFKDHDHGNPAPLRDTEQQKLKQRIAALDDAVTSLFFRNYPRRSRAVEAIFFLLFVIVMLPLWPLAAVCLLDRLSGKNY